MHPIAHLFFSEMMLNALQSVKQFGVSMRRSDLQRCLVGLCLSWTTGCRTPATQIELVMDTDVPQDRQLDLRIVSFAGRVDPASLANAVQQRVLREYSITQSAGQRLLPGSVGILPTNIGSNEPVTVWIRGRVAPSGRSPEVLLDRVARLNFVRGQSGRARVFLSFACGDRATGCTSVGAPECTVSARCREQGATCGDRGECVAPEVAVEFSDGGLSDSPTVNTDATTGRDPGRDVSMDGPNVLDGESMDVPSLTDGSDAVMRDTPVVDSLSPRDVSATIRPPQPIAPISLGDVTQLRPTFRWRNMGDSDGAQVQLCRDRACTIVLETMVRVGTAVAPVGDLPAKTVIFWRARGIRLGAEGSAFSPTWLLHTPAVSAPAGRDSSMNPHLDINGDGFDDVAVGASTASPGARGRAGNVGVHYGSPMGLAASPSIILEGVRANDRFGTYVANAGDLNGDGFAELAVSSPLGGPLMGAGTVSVFAGTAMGITAAPMIVLQGEVANQGLGSSIAGVGDITQDGYGDLVIGSSAASPGGRLNAGMVQVHYGSQTGISAVPVRVIEGVDPGEQFGASVASAGDVECDGYSDFIVGAPNAAPGGLMNAGSAHLYYGRALAIPRLRELVLSGADSAGQFGCSVASAGDVNRDGFGDVIVGASGAVPDGMTQTGAAMVYLGGLVDLAAAPVATLHNPSADITDGQSVSSAGDVNGDGFGDIVVAAPGALGTGGLHAGIVAVYAGRMTGVTPAPWAQFQGTRFTDYFGRSVARAGDVNGDGWSDVIVGTYVVPGVGMTPGYARVYAGSVAGIAPVPLQILTGVSNNDSYGFSVAR